ncbi:MULTISPECIES: antitoxin Xre-like helix-turn-helix domain-containing protein [unclassified Pseudomonas]|uniref:antitoxin Xre-like helix-turn-helix domain-containing protein n=1 Tax=unclassified Pseudomonas TaxID=196821 RepID=UPI000A1FB74E|nr:MULTISPECIES: antitoxin Xre-like helix-turn-helix domain-containing protein [unclassified Pseudomonas]
MASAQAVLSRCQAFVGLKACLRITQKWRATPSQACRILRISPHTYRRVLGGNGDSLRLDVDQLYRMSLVLNIHAALKMTFGNDLNVYRFPSLSNHNDFFNGRTPLEIMIQGDFISLYETCRRIELLPLISFFDVRNGRRQS